MLSVSVGIAPITPNRGFSSEKLVGVWLCHRRLSWMGVFPSWKMEYLDSCITAAWTCCKKGGHCGRWACIVNVGKAVSP